MAIDAGSLAQSCTDEQRDSIRDIVLTHAHLDHVAGLPLFIDDLFSSLTSPIRVHACGEVIEALENHVFNWEIYPRFSELENEHGSVLEYIELTNGLEHDVAGLQLLPIPVNHKVPSSGFLISDERTTIAFSSDTSVMDVFWDQVNKQERIDALLIECAFPDALSELADVSHHLTPSKLSGEISKFSHADVPIYAINMKPMYRETIAAELKRLDISDLEILEPGRVYEF